MSQLINFPFKNQLTSLNTRGILDINDSENCLPTVIAASLEYLTGKHYEGGQIKDAAYGLNYQGGTAATNYIQYCASQGVRLFAISGQPNFLDQQVHAHLAVGLPVIGTIPSTYAPPADRYNPGSSHCIAFYKDAPGQLIAMNPWRAFAQAYTDQYWESIFCFGQVWVMQLISKGTSPLNIPLGWKLSDDHQTLLAPNGHYLRHAFKDFVLSHQWHPGDVPLEEEHSDGADGTSQLLEQERFTWNPREGVQVKFIGDEISLLIKQVSDLQSNNKALSAQVSSLQAQPKPEPVNPSVISALQAIQKQVSDVLSEIIPSSLTQSVPVVQPEPQPIPQPDPSSSIAGSTFSASLS